MNKKVWMYLVIGWLLSILLPPATLLGMFKAKKA